MTYSSRRIRPLDSLLANQIAAGEVVERPASVLKELLENSLDAGARKIDIDIEQGGTALIRVRDDGYGIAASDLPLALARHATSKVYTLDELMQVTSLGFRGEALASIAAVARLTLSSRSADDTHGVSIDEGGQPVPCAHPRGTTVEVRDLFYNTPARRKFLRAERTEFEHLAEVVRRVALSRMDTAMVLRHNGRQVLSVRAAQSADERQLRLGAICGRPFVQQAVPLEFELAGLWLRGWLLRPEAARAQADLQYFYINGRVIRDRVVTHAVRQAYGDALPAGRHPAYVLYLDMDPAQVDVNVHPTKHEVRFRETRQVHDFLYRALRAAVDEAAGVPATVLGVRDAPGAYQPVGEAASATPASVGGRQLGVVLGRYLLLDEGANGLRVVDLPAVRARQAAAAMRTALARSGQIHPQPLLLPVTLQLNASQHEAARVHETMLAAFGFGLEALGPQQWVVRQVPAVLRHVSPETLVQAALEALAQGAEAATLAAVLAEAGRTLPERGEWEGLVAAACENPAGVSAMLGTAELANLL